MGCCTGTFMRSAGHSENIIDLEAQGAIDKAFAVDQPPTNDKGYLEQEVLQLQSLQGKKKQQYEEQSNELSEQINNSKPQDGFQDPHKNKLGKNMKIRPSLFVMQYQFTEKKVTDSYKFMQLIGKGGFGKVYTATEKATGEIRAIKVIKRQALQVNNVDLQTEYELLKSLDHPNIVKLYEIFSDEQNLFLVTEYCSGGTLIDYFGIQQHHSEKQCSEFMKQIFSAMVYCHKKRIVHRDLKLDNILFSTHPNLETSTLKIIDFGASALMTADATLKKRIGTPSYVAPEILGSKGYDEKCDTWSCGVILYVLIIGSFPFQESSNHVLYKSILTGQFDIKNPLWEDASSEAKDLIRRMLVVNPKERISMNDCYNHHWIQQENADDISNPQILRQLLFLHGHNKLQSALKQFVAIRTIDQQQQKELMLAFQQIDQNGDGTLSKEELGKAFRLSKMKQRTIKMESIFNDLDANDSGKVDYTEFLSSAMRTDLLQTQQKIRAAFRLFDIDNDGFITKTEIQKLFGGEHIEESAWQDILTRFDSNLDGKISEDEFLEIICQKVSILQSERNIF